MMAEEPMETSEEERAELFRYLQGEVTFEQYQAWKELNRNVRRKYFTYLSQWTRVLKSIKTTLVLKVWSLPTTDLVDQFLLNQAWNMGEREETVLFMTKCLLTMKKKTSKALYNIRQSDSRKEGKVYTLSQHS